MVLMLLMMTWCWRDGFFTWERSGKQRFYDSLSLLWINAAWPLYLRILRQTAVWWLVEVTCSWCRMATLPENSQAISCFMIHWAYFELMLHGNFTWEFSDKYKVSCPIIVDNLGCSWYFPAKTETLPHSNVNINVRTSLWIHLNMLDF